MSRYKTMSDTIGKKPSSISIIPNGKYEMTVESVSFDTIKIKKEGATPWKVIKIEGRTTNTQSANGDKMGIKNQITITIPTSKPADYEEFAEGADVNPGYAKGSQESKDFWIPLFSYKSYDEAMFVLLHQAAGYPVEDFVTLLDQVYVGMDDVTWKTTVETAIMNGISVKGNTIKFLNEQYNKADGSKGQRQTLLSMTEPKVETQIID